MQLLQHLEEIAERASRAPAVALISDYDGTLTPIVSQPDLAILADSTRDLLRELAGLERMHVAIVSGRSIEDIESKIGLEVSYAGNHGLEIECMQSRFREPTAAKNAPLLQAIVASLHKHLDRMEGVVLENKGLSASIHYRKTHPENEPVIRLLAEQTLRSYDGQFVLREGKKVFEIRPSGIWNKGTAALWILDRLPRGALPVCLGDDTTDEDMFTALSHGVTISVGPRDATVARYHAASVDEAIRFLVFLRDTYGKLQAQSSLNVTL